MKPENMPQWQVGRSLPSAWWLLVVVALVKRLLEVETLNRGEFEALMTD